MQTQLAANIATDIQVSLSLSDGSTYSVQNLGNSSILGATDHVSSGAPLITEYSFRLDAGDSIFITPEATKGVWLICTDANSVGVEESV